MLRATWYCIDIECSGPVPGLYDMVSLGAVSVTKTDEGYQIGTPFYVEICPTAPRFDAGAMAVNGLNIEELRANGTPMEEALDALTAFVNQTLVQGTEPVFVGHNAPFDWSFVNYAYHLHDRKNPFGYKAFDTKAFAAGVLKLHWFDSNKEQLAECLSLPEVEEEKVHRADWDAWYQAHILVQLLQRQ